MIVPTTKRPPEKELGSPIGMMILGLFLLLGGVAGLWAGYDRATLGNASEKWDDREGRVISAEVEKSRERSSTGGRSGWQYYAKISYRYSVDGVEYTGTRLRFDDPPGGSDESGKREAEEFLARFPMGEPISVYVNPYDPTEAVLEQGTSDLGVWMPAGFGVIATGGAIWMILYAVRLRRKREEEAAGG